MTTREFAARIIEEHFTQTIDHLKSGWGHNFNADFKDRRDNTYAAIRLILEFWNYTKDSTSLLIAWLKEPQLETPWNSSSMLAWNLYYSLMKEQTEYELRLADKKNEMFSLLRSIELNKQLKLLTEEQQKRLITITSYIGSK